MKKAKSKIIFPIIYVVAVLGAAILGMLSNSYFAYDIVDNLWADILYLLCISALYVTAYVQELLSECKTCDIVIHSFVFLGSLLCFYLFYFFGVYFLLIAIAYSAALMCLLAARFILRIRATQSVPDDSKIDVKPSIAIFATVLFAMAIINSINYVSEIYMAWTLIPTAIISVILGGIAILLLFDVYRAKLIPIGKSILVAILGFFAVYSYCWVVIGISNYAFDYSDPKLIECAVLDMNISGGARTPTTHELKVEIDNEEMWVDVPAAVYFNTDIDDTVTIKYYSGAFGFAYVLCDGDGE